MTAVRFLAGAAPVDPTTGKGPEWGKAAPIALLIVLLMGIALFLLIKSMNRQLKRVPSDFMRGGAPALADPADQSNPADQSDPAAPSAAVAVDPAAAPSEAAGPTASSPPGEPGAATRS